MKKVQDIYNYATKMSTYYFADKIIVEHCLFFKEKYIDQILFLHSII